MPTGLDGYEIFYAVASEQNITAASRTLFLTQPTVSRAIQNLEQELGCTLFVRSKKGVRLTPEGEILYQHVSRARGHIREAQDELRERRMFRQGVVRIGASEMTLHHYLLPRLEPFHARYPGVKLKISNGSTPASLAALRAGFLDFAVLTSPIEEGFSVTKLESFRDIAVAGPAFSELREKTLSYQDLSQYPLILLEAGTSTRSFWDGIFQQAGASLRPDIELETADLVAPIAAHNLGIGLVPEPFARKKLSEGELFAITLQEPPPERWICAVRDEEHPLSMAGAEFLRMLNEDTGKEDF
ncbi:MAG: LysR family transcriptional regulator [Candidatus Merdivicinus sp.]|jgi:DNA-binding transcriptional LysR family regulator